MGNWVNIQRDADTGIELVHAHFKGFAYDPHFHSSYLIGVTELGNQQFHCRRKLVNSHQGQVFMLEPEEVHDGYAPEPLGFTYKMLHIDQDWLKQKYQGLFTQPFELEVASTLNSDPLVAQLVDASYRAMSNQEPQLMKDSYLDLLLERLAHQNLWSARENSICALPDIALKIKEILHENLYTDLDLNTLAQLAGADRFFINRVFKQAFNCAPHQYLIRLRLDQAKILLKAGIPASMVANSLCFADQSHLGRWFKRCYGLTLRQYQSACTNVLSSSR
ncbi:AraC family transcriptional regulator [Acinetobacter sp. ANC 3813]|uniref:AraC family transcriptional regulator n=1 Tax=Acinetobacter sp. ANC 3813 TaxID=1977873 RepID=UPI000A34BD2D|nr:AraC family transcriptional regulator [Acinetobacter sp. ANC 3813]OTG90087.1 AraC family transcriptional regulator [Acinetobacter sp. ANC 3813]